jgi:hypothetical protein
MENMYTLHVELQIFFSNKLTNYFKVSSNSVRKLLINEKKKIKHDNVHLSYRL